MSHGCIRVQNPFQLASFLIDGTVANSAQWEQTALGYVGSEPVSKKIDPIPVYIFATTTLTFDGGAIAFGPDVYGQDERIVNALDQMANAQIAAKAIQQGN